jgi:hypothetical protein
MRFVANGPSIPDDLLVARDEGRVVFICGAGVSQARAHLPDFHQLTRHVIKKLGVTPQDPARKLLDVSEELDKHTGVAGIISADRVFGLLERDFSVRDIEQAVASALKPPVKVNLSAHRIMLDLAKLPDGRARLITTNFDLLFEACDSKLQCCRPPRLPDPMRDEEFEGIIHLHGRVDRKYQNAEGDGFVLSSAGFGRAYLAEGWATSFIRSIIDQYTVVFVGYAADDPPVHYLLEALNSYKKSLRGVYAFQAGNAGDAEAKWRYKGAIPVAYDEAANHKVLWDTLEAWAERARNPNAWFEKIITMSQKGPETLSPHERGQVAHIVSTHEGARRFAKAELPPPAEWLCVFDPCIRYMAPGSINIYAENKQSFDPFYDAYGLDNDTLPPRLDPQDHFRKRDLPFGEWDAFALNASDIKNLQDDHYAALRGHGAINVPRLSSRLEHLSVWISRVCHQPAAAWWAAGQKGVHHSLQDLIRSQLVKSDKDTCSSEVYKAWRIVLAVWKDRQRDADLNWHQLKTSVDRNGWTIDSIKEFAAIRRPYLSIDDRPRWSGPKPPAAKEEIQCNEMVSVDVKYPTPYGDADIPDDFLLLAVREFRNNLEQAVYLEQEIGGYGLHHHSPIEPDKSVEGDSYERTHGISSILLYYVSLFKRLVEKDPQVAIREYLAWRDDEETVFDLLRIWIAGNPRIFSRTEAGELLMRLSMRSFWEHRHQRDLLLTLEKRWNDFPKATRIHLERRLLLGPPSWESEEKTQYIDRRAWTTLNLVHWLAEHGCRFSFDLSKKSEKLRKQAPEWKPEYAAKAAHSLEGRGGFIKRETEYSTLLAEPPEVILQKAKELSSRDFERLTENDPFAGLSTERADLALAALVSNAGRNDYPEWAWRTFLSVDARKKDASEFSAQIGSHILEMSDDVICGIVSPVSEWFLNVSKGLLATQQERFWQIWERLIVILKSKPQSASSNILRQKNEPDYATEGLNAPVGKLAQALLNDPAINNLGKKKSLPSVWKERVEELLHLEGNLRRHALVMFTHSLEWLYIKDPRWTRANLISCLEADADDQKAFWSGFFWNPQVHSKLFEVLRPYLVRLVYDKTVEKQGHLNTLSAILLAYWWNVYPKTGKRFVSNSEMREILLQADENFRVHTLWQAKSFLTGKKADRRNLPIFLTDVWPRHKKAKSPRISTALCELAFTDTEAFGSLADVILPLVSKVDRHGFFIYKLEDSKIIDLYPEKLLALLCAVLPDDTSEWPYGIGSALKRIGEVKSALSKDKSLIELMKRLGA